MGGRQMYKKARRLTDITSDWIKHVRIDIPAAVVLGNQPPEQKKRDVNKGNSTQAEDETYSCVNFFFFIFLL